jgi:hypothetical protein
MHRNRSHDAVIRVYDDVTTVVETHEPEREFGEPQSRIVTWIKKVQR